MDKLSIRKSAKKIKISTRTAFALRFKVISCLEKINSENSLTGNIELDEYYLSVNLKGTKKIKCLEYRNQEKLMEQENKALVDIPYVLPQVLMKMITLFFK